MSQAHYLRCTWFIPEFECSGQVVAALHVRMGRGNPVRPLCRHHLNVWLDECDDPGWMRRDEPLKIEWIFSPDTRWCIVHHWPAELCEGWSHRTLIERLRATYADGRPSARSDDPT